MPKTLGEIAIEAGLVNKASAAKAGRMAEDRKQPLVVVLIRELGVDEVALVAALRKQTRVPLIDPAGIEVEAEALRQLPRDVCGRLRVLPLSLTTDGSGKLLRIAMADPTDTAAIAEIEQLTHCDVDVSALPLSAIDELVDRGYRQINTAVVSRAGNRADNRAGNRADNRAGERAGDRAGSSAGNAASPLAVTSRGRGPGALPEPDGEVSVTAQIPLAALQATAEDPDLASRLQALVGLLIAKGLITEAELAEAWRKPVGSGSESQADPGAAPADARESKP